MVLFDFSKDKSVMIDGVLYEYNEDLLEKIIEHKEIFVIQYPGSYTGIRKSMAITKAISFLRPIKVFGINLLRDFGFLFSKNGVFYKEKHIINVFDGHKIYLVSKIEEIPSGFWGNIEHNGGYIDFSIANVYQNLDKIQKIDVFQEYYDKFSK